MLGFQYAVKRWCCASATLGCRGTMVCVMHGEGSVHAITDPSPPLRSGYCRESPCASSGRALRTLQRYPVWPAAEQGPPERACQPAALSSCAVMLPERSESAVAPPNWRTKCGKLVGQKLPHGPWVSQPMLLQSEQGAVKVLSERQDSSVLGLLLKCFVPHLHESKASAVTHVQGLPTCVMFPPSRQTISQQVQPGVSRKQDPARTRLDSAAHSTSDLATPRR